ncbi:putative ribonuclease H-like domain-containing protein [Tanacetum coccineum]|uniref:Ribonuclease H-like domain-containing protein n=1 Tax=Tanacetum coccineum TaxID=301880 RepID=A0ABQ4YMD5_9ASTR
MCDKKNNVLFTETECLVLSPNFKLLDESQVLLKVPRQNNMYSFNLKYVVPSGGLTYLIAKAIIDESNLWHRRLGHINFKTMNKLVRGNLVRGLPSKLFENDHTCVACQKGKQHKAPLDETSGILKTFITGIEYEINHKVKIIRCDNGTEFKNNDMNQFCGMKGIKREFSVARTSQQNGIAERKNKTLIEAARTMLADSLLPTTFWAEAVNTACYVQNRVLVIKPHNKTPYELLLGRPPSISFMRPFGCPVTILNTLDPLGKFDKKADDGFLVGYSINSKAFRVFNTRTRKVEENLHINFLENKPIVAGSCPEWLFDIDSLIKSMNYEPVTAENQTSGDAGIETNVNAWQAGQERSSDHEYILPPLMLSNSSLSSSTQSTDDKDADEVPDKGDIDKKGYANSTNRDSTTSPSVSTVGPSINTASENIKTGSPNINTASPISNYSSMQYLENTGIVDDAYDDREVGAEADLNNLENTMNVSLILTTRIHKDHLKDKIIRDINSATQTRRMTKISEEHAMSAFLYGTIEEEVYMCQPPGFEDPQFPDKVYKVYVDDIIFGSTKKSLLQQKEYGIFISQDKYVTDILKRFYFVIVKTVSKAFVRDEEAKNVDVHLYRSMIGSLMYLTAFRPDITFVVYACARFQVTPKCKHTIVANSTTEAEYVAAANCCGQKERKLAIPGQTTTGKEFSNPLMAGSLPKTISIKFWKYSLFPKILNSVKKIHAIVDGKALVITKSSVRNDLLFDDEDGITCLTNDEIFENLTLMGNRYRWQSQAPRNHGGAPAQIKSERVLKQPNEPPFPEGHTSGSGEGRMEHTFELMDIVPPTPHDSPLPGGNVDMEDLHVYKIIRANGNTSYHKSLFSMLRKFDRQDLVDLHRLVMKRFKDNTTEGYNLLLWGDLKVMFEQNAEDEIWSNQQDWTLISWKLYENYRVHTLLMDGTLNCFNMLVEKRVLLSSGKMLE